MGSTYFALFCLLAVALLPATIWLRARLRSASIELSTLLPEPYDIGLVAARYRAANLDLDGRREFADPVAISDSWHWEHPVGDSLELPTSFDGALAATAAVVGARAMHLQMAIDSHVYAGIERMTGRQFESLGDLSAKVMEYKHDFWDGLSAKALHKVAGHVAEEHVAQHFTQAGVEVEWPETSNQAGWDLLLDGQQVNVKLLRDAANLSAHFAKYPHIPSIIPADADNIPANAYYFDPADGLGQIANLLRSGQENTVIVDTSLSHDAVMDQTEYAADALLGTSDAVDAAAPGIPFITLALSGWREAKLLSDSKTDLRSAAKNVSLDIVGTSAGGIAGAKLGGLVGSALGPPGAALGALLGGIGGAVVGRAGTNKVKHMPYDSAVARVKQTEMVLGQRARAAQRRAQTRLEMARRDLESKLRDLANHELKLLADHAAKLQAWRVGIEQVSRQHARSLVDSGIVEVSNIEGRLQTLRRGWRFKLRSHASRMNDEAVLDRLHEKSRRLLLYRAQLEEIPIIDRASLFELLASHGLCRAAVLDALARTERERRSLEEAIRTRVSNATARLVRERVAAQEMLVEIVSELRTSTREALAPSIAAVRDATRAATVEANKIGK